MVPRPQKRRRGLLPTEPEFERAERLWLMRSRLNAAAAPNLSHNNRLEVS